MLVTLFGIVMEFRPLQPSKASSPIIVTLFGMDVFLQPVIRVLVSVSIIALQLLRESYFKFPASTTIEVKLLHPPNGLSPILVTLLGIVIESKPLSLEKE